VNMQLVPCRLAPDQSGGRMRRIFLIDDDGLIRELLARHLERENYQARAFNSAADALPEILSDPPDVLISDIHMPGMNGLDLVRKLRSCDIVLPVILMSANAGSEIIARARGLGVKHVLKKPLKDVARLAAIIEESVLGSGAPGEGPGLDRVRLDFLNSLSHQLRTPLTALKLALDGLYSDGEGSRETAQNKLVGISHRNVNRIVRLVEKQLDLLLTVVGGLTVARRLVDLNKLIEDVLDSRQGIAAERALPADGDTESEVLLFTDPDRLRTVIQHFLGEKSDGDHVDLVLHTDSSRGSGEVVLEFKRNRRDDGCSGSHASPRSGAGDGAHGMGHDFETRACQKIVGELGGEVVVGETVRISLPRRPPFDRRKDLVNPLQWIRKTARLNGRSVSFLRCELRDGSARGGCGVEADREVLRRGLAALGDGGYLVRGREPGSYYLAMIDQDRDLLERVLRSMKHRSPAEDVSEWMDAAQVENLQSGDLDPEDLVLNLETVS
jgi:CheY-like chemotaxis protein